MVGSGHILVNVFGQGFELMNDFFLHGVNLSVNFSESFVYFSEPFINLGKSFLCGGGEFVYGQADILFCGWVGRVMLF